MDGDKEVELNVPFLTKNSKSKKTGKVTKTLATFNAFVNMNHFARHKIKQDYKQLLKEWFIDDFSRGNTRAKITFAPVYCDRRKRDSDNIIPTVKYFIDCLVDLGVLVDDDNTEIIIKPRTFDDSATQHYVNIKVEVE